MLAAAPKLAKLLPRLASEHEGEIVATVRAIGRTLAASGADWHDLAREIEHPAAITPPRRTARARRERTPRMAPVAPESLRLLRAGLQLDAFSAWERDFADTILKAIGRPGWRPSPKQIGIISRLIGKAQEAEAHP